MKKTLSAIAAILLILYMITKVSPGLTPAFLAFGLIFLIAFLVIIVIARKTNEDQPPRA